MLYVDFGASILKLQHSVAWADTRSSNFANVFCNNLINILLFPVLDLPEPHGRCRLLRIVLACIRLHLHQAQKGNP
jgi:hypothetical protein